MPLRACVRAVLVLVAMMLLPRTVQAQQTCYAYDGLGRLSGVIDENRNAAFYDYDAVGNIVGIRRVSPSGPVTIFTVYPLSGAPGERFEIFGVGFGSNASDNQVTIGGVAANVSSTVPCTLIVDVPPDGITGTIHVTTPAGQAISADSFLVSRFAIAGTSFSALPNISVQYTVTSNGCNDPAVVWRVNGKIGGDSVVGTITVDGLYHSPAVIPTPPFAVIRADSVACPTLFDSKTLNLVTSANTFVFASASATHGFPPVILPPRTVVTSASARYGAPPVVLPPNTVLDDAGVSNGAVLVSSVSPSSARRPGTVQVTITGTNLTGATGLTIFGSSSSTPDALITVSNIAVNANGTSLTATLTMAGTAALGARTIRVNTPNGNSTIVQTTANTFTVTQ